MNNWNLFLLFFDNDVCLKIILESTEDKLWESKTMGAICILNEMRNSDGRITFVTSKD